VQLRRVEPSFLGFSALILGLLTTAFAQVATEVRVNPLRTPENALGAAHLRVDSDLVLVPVSVCDPMNRPVSGLSRENFRVFENGVEQALSVFAMDDDPVAVGLVLDVSGSMHPKMQLARKAASEFFRRANDDDEFFFVQFSDKPKLLVPLTRDPTRVERQLESAKAKGRTALLDALMLSLTEAKRSQKSRKTLLVISDGGDNSSRYSERELINMVREINVLIYAIWIYGGAATPEELAGPSLLKQSADESGGRHVTAPASELPGVAAKIALEMRSRYLLGYTPADDRRDGRYRSVRVELAPPQGLPALRASWRRGYYAPSD
jgi:VWFA-related protein